MFTAYTSLPKPPSSLIRRFVFEQVDTDDGLGVQVDDTALPEDLSDRWWNATCFRSELLTASQPGWVDPATYDFRQTPCDPQALDCLLEPGDVWDFYRSHKEYAVDMGFDEQLAEFDLHDVYVSIEDHLRMRHRWGRGYKPGSVDAVSNERYIKQVESILCVVGQAISTG